MYSRRAYTKDPTVARSPSKLLDSLRQRDLSESMIKDHLVIVKGSVTDLDAVRRTIQPGGDDSPVVDIIVSGIGGKVLFHNPLSPTLDNPTICQDGIRVILSAAAGTARSSSDTDKKPTLIVLSTTGVTDKCRDVPFAMMPLYYWLLKVPHEDKKVMEGLIREESVKSVQERGIGEYTIVRPSMLTDSVGVGLNKIQVGVEDKPAVGYFIAREDVGQWVFEVLVKPGLTNDYLGQAVSITA